MSDLADPLHRARLDPPETAVAARARRPRRPAPAFDRHAERHLGERPGIVDPSPIIHGCDDQLRCTWPDASGEAPWDERAVGLRDDELLEPDSAQRLMSLKRDAVVDRSDQRRELRLTIAGRTRTFDARVVRQRGSAGSGLIVILVDVTARAESAARERLLAAVDDAARRTADAPTILAGAARLLAEHLQAERVAWAQVEPGGKAFSIDAEHVRRHDGAAAARPELGRRHAFASLSLAARAALRAGRPWAVDDARAHVPDAPLLAAARGIGLNAIACAPARRAGRLAGAVLAFDAAPRRWTDDELALLARVADRCRQAIDRGDVERDLRASQGRLRLALDHARLGTWEIDLDTDEIRFSARGRETFGLTADEPVDRDRLREMLLPADRAAAKRQLSEAIAGHAPLEAEYHIRRRSDGAVRTILCTGRIVEPAEPEAGGRGRLVGVVVDVTDQRHAQAQQQDRLDAERHARAEAERIGRLKDEFLATLSHELRTPLNAILGWAQLLRRRPPAARELEQGLDTIERNAKLQARLVEDLLDMSRIISGKVRLEVRPIAAADAIDAALAIARPAAEARRVRLERDVPIALADAAVVADAGRLQQVLWNLVSNAIKFTPADGTVRVGLATPRAGELAIVVADTGVGIDADFLPFVFDRFRQADGSSRRTHGGLGLGLSIVKSLVEMHAGRATVASDGAGRGATFTVTMPAAPRAASAACIAPSPDRAARAEAAGELAGLRILVVDDDADARDLIRRLLADHEADVTTASSVDAALAALVEFRPTLIVSDIGMPGRDGYDLVYTVRALAAPALSRTPCIALTAFARATDRSRALDAGFDAHLAKPVDAADLIAACRRLACRVPRERAARDDATDSSLSS